MNIQLSSQALLSIAAGTSLCLGLLHVCCVRRRDDPQLWVALLALLTTLYQAARWVQLSTADPAAVIGAARVQAAVSPLLIASLCANAIALSSGRLSRRMLGFAAANVALAALALTTPWFVTDDSYPARDPFGWPYLALRLGPALLVLPAYVVGALVWLVCKIAPTPELSTGEWRLLIGCLVAPGLLGLSSLVASCSTFPALAEYGPIVMTLGLSRLEVQRRRRLEDGLGSRVAARTSELVESEARYRELLENAPVGVFACDLSGRIRMANARLLAIAGSPSLGARLEGNVLEAPEAIESGLAASVRRCLEQGETVSAEHHLVSRWGRAVDLRLVAAPLRDGAGVQQGALALIEDVSERRALEERLRRSQKLEAVGELATGVAEQIDEPMALARTNLAALREDWNAVRKALDVPGGDRVLAERIGECEALIEESLEGIERTISIARDMREFASRGSGERRRTELNGLVAEAVRIAAHHRRGETRIEERYGSVCMLWGSPGALRQVFVNLLVNALQAVGDSGTVVVETGVEGGHAAVRVRDDGPGIAPEIRDRLFDPFFTTKPAGEGTGLGLYVSHEIVRAHAGEITIAAELGRGARFQVRLPLGPS